MNKNVAHDFGIKHMNTLQRGYLIGMIDGEGTVSFLGSSRKSYHANIIITNTNHECIEYIQSFAGGNIYTSKCDSGKTLYRVRWSGRLMRDLLPQIKKHLVVKRLQAEIMTLYFSIFPFGTSSSDWLGVHRELKDQFVVIMKQLNCRNVRKEGEFRESPERIILSQVRGEILGKVQRLEPEAKGRKYATIVDKIKKRGKISARDVNNFSRAYPKSLTKFDIVKRLENDPDVRIEYGERSGITYVYACNGSTSAFVEKHDIVRAV